MATKQDILNLEIHKLTQDQYDEAYAAGQIDPNAIYLTPEEVVDLSGYATTNELDEVVGEATAAINNIISSKAGGTEVTLNGTSKKGTVASFYAPIDGGTDGYILKSNGSGAPTWLQTLPVSNGGTGKNALPSGQALIGNGTGEIQTKAITDSNQTTVTLSSISTNLVSERAVNGAINTAIANLVDSAPTTLNTLNKLATALGENKDSITTILEEIGKKEDAITTLPISKGGTGGQSFVANRLLFYDGTNKKLASSENYVSSSQLAINATAMPTDSTFNLYVNGSARIEQGLQSQTLAITSSSGYIAPKTTNTGTIGTSAKIWKYLYGGSYYVYDPNYLYNGGVFYTTSDNTTTSKGTYLILGNQTYLDADGNAKQGNRYGILRFYNQQSGYVNIIPGTNDTNYYTLYLPGANGQFVYHKNNTTIGSATQPVYINSTGEAIACTSPSILINLGATTADNVFKASPRPGVTGTLRVANGGTGATNAENARINLGLEHFNKEAYLTWGGQNLANSISPIDAAMSNIHSANRFAFAKPAGIIIEYSTDGGTSYVDYEASNATKINLVSGMGPTLYAGKKSSGGTVNDKLRITLIANSMGVYTRLRKILINMGIPGSVSKCQVKVEKSINSTPDTFTELGTYTLGGNTGWNSIPFPNDFAFGSTPANQCAKIRLTFFCESTTGGSFYVRDVIGFGDTYWNYPSQMAKTGHLYEYDESQNAKFPAAVKATRFTTYDPGTGKIGGELYTTLDSTTTGGKATIVALGNNLSNAVGNRYGVVRVYGSDSGYIDIRTGTQNSSNYTLYLPGASGQLVYHENDTQVGSSTIPTYIATTGQVTPIAYVGVAHGGTGATTAAAARTNLAASWCQTKTGTTSATAGWYRVAQAAVNIDNTMGTFEIKANISGYHSVTTLMAGTSFGISPSIQQLSHYAYSNTGISKARIVYHPTYSNNYAYLEIYQPQAVARSMTIKLTEGFGWTIIAPTAVSSIPTGYSNKEITLVSGKIVSDIIGANIQARSFDSKGAQENQIRVWHSENETDALYLFGNQDGRRGLYDMDIGSIISIGSDYVNFNSYRSSGAQWSKGRTVASFKSTFVPDRTSDQYSGFYPILSRKTYSGSWDVGCLMPGYNAVNADGTYNAGDMPSGAHNKLYHEAFHFIHSYDSTYESGTHTAPLRIYGNGLVQAQKLGITTAGGYGTGNPPTGTADDPLFVGQLYFKIIE